MDTKQQIVTNWLPRYTGVALKQFGRYILLTNFDRYVTLFAQWHKVQVHGRTLCGEQPAPLFGIRGGSLAG